MRYPPGVGDGDRTAVELYHADARAWLSCSGFTMSSTGDELDFRGVGGHLTETPFSVTDLTREITKKLQRDRYAWLTTVEPTGLPSPMLVWFTLTAPPSPSTPSPVPAE